MNFNEPPRSPDALSLEGQIRLLEDSKFDPVDKLDLMLLLLGRKRGMQWGDFRIVDAEDREKILGELRKNMAEVKKLLTDLGLCFEVVKEIKDEDDFTGFSILAAKNKEDLKKFVKAELEGDDKTFGLMVGYPPTATETYLTIEEIKSGKPDKRFDIYNENDLPREELEKLRAEGVLPFLDFTPSREHWPDELEFARTNQRIVRERAPRLYQERLSARK